MGSGTRPFLSDRDDSDNDSQLSWERGYHDTEIGADYSETHNPDHICLGSELSGPEGPSATSQTPEGPSAPSQTPEGQSPPSQTPESPSAPSQTPESPSALSQNPEILLIRSQARAGPPAMGQAQGNIELRRSTRQRRPPNRLSLEHHAKTLGSERCQYCQKIARGRQIWENQKKKQALRIPRDFRVCNSCDIRLR
ncbi:UNVERIFIED_CONTAM: hypothetical protein FKN15_009679 [Acipenser sinensis]